MKLTPPYPQSYLAGNISLQDTTETHHKNTIRRSLQWLAMSAMWFAVLLIGIALESGFLSGFAIIELIVSSIAVYEMQDIPKEHQ